MNSNHIEGAWQEMRGLVRQQWGRLTDDDLDVIAGQRDRLIGALQRHYGTARDVVERKISAFERRVSRGLHRP